MNKVKYICLSCGYEFNVDKEILNESKLIAQVECPGCRNTDDIEECED